MNRFKKCATIWHPAIVPSVGSNPYYSSSLDLCTACELYTNEELKLATIQIRSTLEYQMTSKFFHELRNELESFGIINIIILSSMFDYEQHLITNNKFYFIKEKDEKTFMQSNNVILLKKDINGKYCTNGSGFALKLYEILSSKFECILLGKYVSEGDNRPDACSILEKLVNVLKLEKPVQNLSVPRSWDFVFGKPPPSEIY
ncbi:hypothetical protein JTB14_017001 [Gonioctena quinquepunctata]|nr:hypothetical protein JTB14_017001 [Gonioctena quinquepunctata]